jgi:hypothetical protein
MLLNTLRKKHSLTALIRSGVLVGDRGEFEINPMFTGRPNAIVPLRSAPDAAPFDLISGQGAASRRLPLSVAVHDHRVQAAISESGYLFAAFEVPDLLCLWALGMPVVPACGLEQFTPSSLAAFRGAFGFTEPKPQAIPHHLVLPAWSPYRFSRERPPDVDRVARNLIRCRSCLGLPLHQILVWQPTTTEIEGLAKCLQLGGKSDVVAAISSSLAHSSTPLAPEPAEANPVADLLKIEKRLHAALMNPETGRTRLRRLLRKQRQGVDESIVKPLLEKAQDESDPEERIRLTALAQFTGTLRSTTVSHAARLEKEISDHGLRGDGKAFDVQGLAKAYDVLLKLCKESE